LKLFLIKHHIKKLTMRLKFFLYLVLSFSLLISCNQEEKIMNLTKNKYPESVKNAVIYEVNIRQYTEEGTLNAFEQHFQNGTLKMIKVI